VAEGTGTGDRWYSTNSGGSIGGIICRTYNSGTNEEYFYHYDRLGNVMAITDADGNCKRLYTMEAFGNVLEVGSSDYYSEYADVQPYHLTTKELDSDTGLYYFNARWYDSTAGRWISRDRNPLDPYSFCFNNPANYMDVDGFDPTRPPQKPTGWPTRVFEWVRIGYDMAWNTQKDLVFDIPVAIASGVIDTVLGNSGANFTNTSLDRADKWGRAHAQQLTIDRLNEDPRFDMNAAQRRCGDAAVEAIVDSMKEAPLGTGWTGDLGFDPSCWSGAGGKAAEAAIQHGLKESLDDTLREDCR
jgi:RHS repeat-associated protein